jgi:hypothetical protein
MLRKLALLSFTVMSVTLKQARQAENWSIIAK